MAYKVLNWMEEVGFRGYRGTRGTMPEQKPPPCFYPRVLPRNEQSTGGHCSGTVRSTVVRLGIRLFGLGAKVRGQGFLVRLKPIPPRDPILGGDAHALLACILLQLRPKARPAPP